MSRYNNNTGTNFNNQNSIKVETRLCTQTGQQHLYDKQNDYLSRFPLGFRGCFNYGATDYFSTQDCTQAQSGNFNKKRFFAELWAHKPYTKKIEFNRQLTNTDNHVGQLNEMTHNSRHTFQLHTQRNSSRNYENNNLNNPRLGDTNQIAFDNDGFNFKSDHQVNNHDSGIKKRFKY